ncbi:MAG TPA: hypothetical protein VES88_12615 [Gemmatimonadaceae bacterium]|nr:hypothetical protein [Gemmatimonadaceae bacterium]
MTAMAAMYTDGTIPTQVYVFRVGATRFAVSDGRASARGNIMLHIFDLTYTYLATIG